MKNRSLIVAAVFALAAGPSFAVISERPTPGPTERRVEAPVRVALNWDQIAGSWKRFAGKARQQWGKLTDDDLEVAKGRRDELVGIIQQRYGITKEEAGRQVDSWMKSLEP